MSTIFSIQVGAAQAVSITIQDDAKVAAALDAYYVALNLGPGEATNREKLETILRNLAIRVRERAIGHYVEQAQETDRGEAVDLYGFTP